MKGKEIIALLCGAILPGCRSTPANLQEALNRLAKSNPKEKLERPVMTCYVMMRFGAKQQVYQCPVCGKKSVYEANTKGAEAVDKLLDGEGKFSAAAQAKMKQFGISISVDDTEFCKSCRKVNISAEEDVPQRQWLIRKTDAAGKPIPGAEWRMYRQSGDHGILEAFFEGKDTIAGDFGGTFALKTYIPRLAELLHLEEPKGRRVKDKGTSI